MENFGEDVLIPIIAIICAIALPIAVCGYLIILAIKSRTKERMELIKQGIIPNSQAKLTPNKYVSLRNGILCIGLSLGIIIGLILQNLIEMNKATSILVLCASVILFLGISYLTFYVCTKDKDLEE